MVYKQDTNGVLFGRLCSPQYTCGYISTTADCNDQIWLKITENLLGRRLTQLVDLYILSQLYWMLFPCVLQRSRPRPRCK